VAKETNLEVFNILMNAAAGMMHQSEQMVHKFECERYRPAIRSDQSENDTIG
jgi:hypothetical protein